MNGVEQIRNHLLDELDLSVRTVESLLARIKQDEWGYRPADNMRTLLELAHHLVSIPATDLAILQEKTQAEVEQVETSVNEIKDPQELGARFRANYDLLREYMLSLSEDELLNKSTKAFYLEQGMVQIKWLIEIVTHSFHHRSQLYNYLKQNGHELQFFMLYS
ncbi:damage-inducible protein DinB [Paenibacillus selenitireducens]|uniref:Damage-inducible protein DinB n=1 Tax=Paenibacillus selenitireducens TaxID=1324314 RepID=A0A1T2X6B8_9BACL|nr:DinB family protein [Paenibacillus selenitireducens]OPA75133.1 damage-inducible protein DinB [Paenibacillus selenitireducens]